MVRRTYNNTIAPVEVSIAIERLLVANYPQSFTPARIDLDSLPTGFVDLGAVVEDTPSFKVTREKFALKTGLPMVTQYQAVQGMDASFACSLHTNSWKQAQYALGNFTSVASATSVASISSITSDKSVFTLTTTPTTPLAVGQQVFVASSAANFNRADVFETRITSVNAAGTSYAVNPPITNAATVGHLIGVYGVGYVRQIIGGRAIRQFALLGVADFIDGVQVVHYMPKVVSATEFTEEFRPDSNGKVPLAFDALGTETTVGSCTEIIVAERYYFPTANEICGA